MTDMSVILWLVLGIIVLITVVTFLRKGGGTAGTQPIIDPTEEPPVPVDLPIGAAPLVEVPHPHPVSPPVSAPEPTALPVASTAGAADDLRKIKGIGPKIVGILQARGVTRYAQIAAWSDADLAAIDAELGSFAGRPLRDNWVDQAALLAAGDVPAYEAKYGKL